MEERAVKGNLSLKNAEAVVRQARAQRNVIQHVGLPTLAVGGSPTCSRSKAAFGQSYSISMDASWEPDFYHRVRQKVEAYDADLGTAQEDLRNTLVSLVAEVAQEYIHVRSYQSQLATSRCSLASQEETYQLTLAKAKSGLATELDSEQAGMTVEETRAQIPSLETSLQQSINSIA